MERLICSTISLDLQLGHTASPMNAGVHGQIEGGAEPVLAAKKMDAVLRTEDPDSVSRDGGSLPRRCQSGGVILGQRSGWFEEPEACVSVQDCANLIS